MNSKPQMSEFRALALVVQAAMGCKRLTRSSPFQPLHAPLVTESFCRTHGGFGWPCTTAQRVTAAVHKHTKEAGL